MKKILLFIFLFIILTGFFVILIGERTGVSVLSVSDSNTSPFERLIPVFGNMKRAVELEILENSLKDKEGTYAIYVRDLVNNENFFINETELFYAASLYKVPVAAGTLKLHEQGGVDLNQEIEYTSADYQSGTGSIISTPIGTKFTVDALLTKLLKESDNTAQVMLGRALTYDKIASAFYLIPAKNHFLQNNTVTAAQYTDLLEQIFEYSYLNPENTLDLENRMTGTIFDDRIHEGLQLDISFAHKIGSWPETSTWHDCGIASKADKEIIVCVLSRNTNRADFAQVAKETGEFVSKLLN